MTYSETNPLRIFSSGGGVQSVAVAVLQAEGLIEPYHYHVFANVGNKAENPDTLRYLEDVLIPYLNDHGIGFVTVQKRDRAGIPVDLFDAVMRTDRRSVIVPAFLEQGGPTHRQCTTEWKIEQVDRFVRTVGASHAEVGLGISIDEFTRVRSTDWHDATISQEGNRRELGFWKRRDYPLIRMRVSRDECVGIITRAGLPSPPKSSCYFCPMKSKAEWLLLRQQQPDLFNTAVLIEDAINAKGLHADKRYHLSRFKIPLRQLPASESGDPVADDCDSGYCHT